LGIIRTFQTASAFTGLTVLENVLVGCREQQLNSFAGSFWPRRWRKLEDEMIARAWALLTDIRLESKAELLASVLSGGERRLVEIARVLMSKPIVLLLDEPTAGVSLGRIRDVEDHIRRIVAAGVAVVLVEHELSVVDRLCDTVYVMGDGQIIGSGSLSELRRREDVVRAYLQA
jgi:branched-chain amino acid transport system ATP-binding protein